MKVLEQKVEVRKSRREKGHLSAKGELIVGADKWAGFVIGLLRKEKGGPLRWGRLVIGLLEKEKNKWAGLVIGLLRKGWGRLVIGLLEEEKKLVLWDALVDRRARRASGVLVDRRTRLVSGVLKNPRRKPRSAQGPRGERRTQGSSEDPYEGGGAKGLREPLVEWGLQRLEALAQEIERAQEDWDVDVLGRGLKSPRARRVAYRYRFLAEGRQVVEEVARREARKVVRRGRS